MAGNEDHPECEAPTTPGTYRGQTGHKYQVSSQPQYSGRRFFFSFFSRTFAFCPVAVGTNHRHFSINGVEARSKRGPCSTRKLMCRLAKPGTERSAPCSLIRAVTPRPLQTHSDASRWTPSPRHNKSSVTEKANDEPPGKLSWNSIPLRPADRHGSPSAVGRHRHVPSSWLEHPSKGTDLYVARSGITSST